MKKIAYFICLAVFVTLSNTSIYSQQQNTTKATLSKEDSAAINAIVMYPESIRIDIFEACMYPAAIVNIASLQKSSSSDFAKLVSPLKKEEQEVYWNISRYPGLISKLVKGGKKSETQIKTILADYPTDIHKDAMEYGTRHYEMLQRIDAIQDETNNRFDQIIADYPKTTQDAFVELLQYPEVISLLNEHLNLTVRAGDRYRRNPKLLLHKADSLNLAITRKNAEDVAAWKEDIEKNPDEAADLKNAATEYSKENGYTQEEINTAPSPEYVSNYNCYPYPYWFGYPVWYPYQYWYPYPFWFDCGFYYDPFGHMVIIGYPSFYFTNWYFYYPKHWHHYPHLGNTYIKHYYGPRKPVNGNGVIVHKWVRDNRNNLPADFISNEKKRIDVIKQVGQLNEDVQKRNQNRPVSTANRDKYLEKNISRYPALNTSRDGKLKVEDRKPNAAEAIPQPVKQPPVRINKPEQQTVPVPKKDTRQPAYDFDKINKAQEYHRNVWEQSQPAKRQEVQQAPQRQQPSSQQQRQPQQKLQQPAPQSQKNQSIPPKRK